MTNIIALEGVRKEFQLGASTIAALRGVDLELEKGRYYSIMGPSGSGKSTLLHILGCMDIPTKGKVWLNGRQVHTLDHRQRTRIRAQEIGFVFQAFHLNPILTALDNVAITLRFMGETRRSAREKAEYWLQRVRLGARISHHPAALSGGERQRVAIARAIAKNPSVILADEPTGNPGDS
jgi:putative ABC transport system ATP-binding protein